MVMLCMVCCDDGLTVVCTVLDVVFLSAPLPEVSGRSPAGYKVFGSATEGSGVHVNSVRFVVVMCCHGEELSPDTVLVDTFELSWTSHTDRVLRSFLWAFLCPVLSPGQTPCIHVFCPSIHLW